jgi:uncharacterized protein (UPF0332 family)
LGFFIGFLWDNVALLLTKGLSSLKHGGVRSPFNKEFIKTGIISEEDGDFYNRMFGSRQREDYEDPVEFDYEKVKGWFDNTKDFIDSIEQVIKHQN